MNTRKTSLYRDSWSPTKYEPKIDIIENYE